MVDETNELSNNMSNSPDSVHANQLACESDEENETCEVTGKNINLDAETYKVAQEGNE